MKARKLAVTTLAVILISCLGISTTSAKIRVVTSINDLGSIAAAVGGDEVEVASISRATTDVHRVEVLPSYMIRVSKAALYLKVGLGLDQWADQIIDGSHNAHLHIVDCSENIEVLEKPTGRVDASMGDIHPNGNPHYWLNPHNGGVIARTIASALAKEDPTHAADYNARAEAFAKDCDAKVEAGKRAVDGMAVKEIITYHRSWSYFAAAYNLQVAGEVEPLPGIPPTGRHLEELVTVIQEHHVPVLLYEPYFSDDAGKFLARQTGINVAKVSPSCDDLKPGSYLAHFDQLIQALTGKSS